MTIPTIEEVAEFMQQIGMQNPNEEARLFWFHHDARGWMLGKQPMKRWRSAVWTWKLNGEKWKRRTDENKAEFGNAVRTLSENMSLKKAEQYRRVEKALDRTEQTLKQLH